MGQTGVIEGALGLYEVVGCFASGAMGHILFCRHRSQSGVFLGEVAIKRIRPELRYESDVVQMFYDEARISSLLSHPNIVRTMEMGTIADGPFMVMELVVGATLYSVVQRLVERKEVMPTHLILEVGCKVLEALSYAHKRCNRDGKPLGIIHRDVSPQNIMLSYTGDVKLFDFGVGKAVDQTHRTNPGLLKGKLAYMSPEQIQNDCLDARSDIFSLGTMLYEALVLVPPFYGRNDAVLMRAVLEQDPPDPRDIHPSFNPELSRILLKALEKSPNRRYESAAAMRHDIDEYIAKQTTQSLTLAETMQNIFRQRIQLEAKARLKRDDHLLVRALSGEYYSSDWEEEDHPDDTRAEWNDIVLQHGEKMFADLPTVGVERAISVKEDVHQANHHSDLASSKVKSYSPDLFRGSPQNVNVSSRVVEKTNDSWVYNSETQEEAIDELRMLAEYAPVPTYVSLVNEGTILYANNPMSVVFGLPQEKLIGMKEEVLFVDSMERRRLVARVNEATLVSDCLVQMRRLDGRRFWSNLTVRLLRYRGVRVIVGALLDLTQRILIEAHLNRCLTYEKNLTRALGALFRVKDEGLDASLGQAFEYLRISVGADYIVLAKNIMDEQAGLLMDRCYVVGPEPFASNRKMTYPYASVPRWKALLERGNVVRGRVSSLPVDERGFVDQLHISQFLLAPIVANGQWLGYLAIENITGTMRTPDWSQDAHAALEVMTGALASIELLWV